MATPSPLRAGAACLIAGWKALAKQKVIPASSATCRTCSGGSVRSTPNASSTSADPELEEAARLPCLTRRTPEAAMTMADIVEMLTVFWRSPPVPTMSIVGPGTSMRWACASMTSANPRISATDSPLTRSAMRKPASWMGVASPLMTSFMAHWACSRVRSEPPTRTVRRSGQVIRPGSTSTAVRRSGRRGRATQPPRPPGWGPAGVARQRRPATTPPATRPADAR